MSALRRSPLKKQSKKRAKANKLYLAKRKAFLALRPLCEVWIALHNASSRIEARELMADIFNTLDMYAPAYSQDIHHREGRAGERFLDENTWMACSRKAHAWIHSHPRQAREWGWLK